MDLGTTELGETAQGQRSHCRAQDTEVFTDPTSGHLQGENSGSFPWSLNSPGILTGGPEGPSLVPERPVPA